MKIRITVGTAMLLTLGSALAGGIIYTKEKSPDSQQLEPATIAVGASDVTPEMIAKWKATSTTLDYSPPMLPI